MAERVATPADAAAAFRTFAAAEGGRIPTYARICRIVAADPDLHGLLLEAPTGQRLPVLLLAALHDVVLGDPPCALAPWYPSVSGVEPSAEDPEPALRVTIDAHRGRILELLRTRQVQTNEVNRCCAWWMALARLTYDDPRPIHLVEIGASAGLNLLLDRFSYRFTSRDELTPGGHLDAGRAGSPVRLGVEVLASGQGAAQGSADQQDSDQWSAVSEDWSSDRWRFDTPIVSRVGLDQRPLDVTDPADVRWLEACVWPEQRVRFDRLTAALAMAVEDPPRVVAGDLVDDLAPLLEAAPDGTHVVVLSSWVLAYVPRARRDDLLELLGDAAAQLAARGCRLSLVTLEADSILSWVTPASLPPDASADERFASILAVTAFLAGGPPRARAIARCQAHLVWAELLR